MRLRTKRWPTSTWSRRRAVPAAGRAVPAGAARSPPPCGAARGGAGGGGQRGAGSGHGEGAGGGSRRDSGGAGGGAAAGVPVSAAGAAGARPGRGTPPRAAAPRGGSVASGCEGCPLAGRDVGIGVRAAAALRRAEAELRLIASVRVRCSPSWKLAVPPELCAGAETSSPVTAWVVKYFVAPWCVVTVGIQMLKDARPAL